MKKITITALCLGLVLLLGMGVFKNLYAATPNQEIAIQQPIIENNNNQKVSTEQPTIENSKNVNDKEISTQKINNVEKTTNIVCPYNHENCNNTHQNQNCQYNHENCDGNCLNKQGPHHGNTKRHSSSNGQHHRNKN